MALHRAEIVELELPRIEVDLGRVKCQAELAANAFGRYSNWKNLLLSKALRDDLNLNLLVEPLPQALVMNVLRCSATSAHRKQWIRLAV